MCQGSTGRMASSFSFLIQKEPASRWGSETVSSVLNADFHTSFFCADVLKKCALIVVH